MGSKVASSWKRAKIPSVVKPTMSILKKAHVGSEASTTGNVRMESLRGALEPRLLDVIRLLLDHGADPNAVDSAGTAVLIHTAN